MEEAGGREEAEWLLWGSTPEPRRSCSNSLLMMVPRQPRIIRFVTWSRDRAEWLLSSIG